MDDLQDTWKEVTRILREARSALGAETDGKADAVPAGMLVGNLTEFDEFLAHNEFELAWDALAAVAEKTSTSSRCWHWLARAAQLMRLPSKEEWASVKATPRVAPDRALTIAQTDAKATYQGLSSYRISILLQEDGWHIDYELKDANACGGGPHYVIDALSGAIISKRYEQ